MPGNRERRAGRSRTQLPFAPWPQADAAEIRREKDQIVELRLDHHLPGGVDQPPLAVLEISQEAEIEADANPLGADVDPGLASRRQDHALAIGFAT